MLDLYTGFSNYEEININNRRISANEDREAWKERRDEYEEYRKEWNRTITEEYVPSVPLHVDIELSDACNLRCKMCAHGIGSSKKVGTMNTELAYRIIEDCSDMGIKSIKFNWRGEPCLHKDLPKLIEYAKKEGILEVAINTNGVPVSRNPYFLQECASSGIDRIIFSVDGHSKETFESIRIGANYDKVKNNILNLLEYKKNSFKDKPLIRIQMVRTKDNEHEVKDFIAFWSPIVDDVRISDVMDRGQGDMSVGDQITTGRKRCPQPFQRLVIARDGGIYPCCADWNQEYKLGCFVTMSLQEAWESPKMGYLREKQRNVELGSVNICKNCCAKESYTWKKV